MVKTFAILLLCVLLGAKVGERYIVWNAEQKLSWDDFSGVADETSEYKAITKSKISIGWDCTDKVFAFEATAKFDKENSWKKDHVTDELLAHEQLHFDLAELYARKMRKHFSKLPNGCALTTEQITTITQQIIGEWGDREDLYDKETDHSKNPIEQARWEKMVRQELEALQRYAL